MTGLSIPGRLAGRRSGDATTPGSRGLPDRLPQWWRSIVSSEVDGATRVLVWALAVIGALAVWLVVFALGASSLQEQHAQHNLYTSFRQELAQETAPLTGAVSPGTPVAMLNSSAGGLHDIVVVAGTSGKELRDGPGLYPGAPLPGQFGTSVLMGRSSSFGAPFGKLTSLHAGDVITATTGQGVFRYVVEDVRHAGDPVPVALTGDQSRMTLVTSEGAGWRSGWAPTRAVFVDALLKGTPQYSAGGVAVATPADGVLARDTSDLYPMVLWLQLLAIGIVAAVWLRGRWGGWQAWLVAAPVVLAALWGTSSTFWPLLPNLL